MKRVLLLLGVLASVAACDPVHADAVDALGGETAGVRRGPFHRPGQPCQVCHDGAPGDPSEFTVAGTVFLRPSGLEGVSHVTVEMTDANGTFSAETNAAGNFYLGPRDWQPVYPIQRVVLRSGQRTAEMYGLIGRSASCASCHFDPPGAGSPGHISLQLDDGGTPL